MRICVGVATILILAIGVLPASATITPGQPNGGEPWLYQIYNQLFATNFQTTDDPDFLALQTGIQTFQVGELVGSVTFEVVWRQSFLEDTFGIYTAGGGNAKVLQTDLLGPFTNDGPGQGQGPVTGASITLSADQLPSIFGVYDRAVLPGNSSVGFTWFSEPNLNDGQPQTGDGEIHALVLATPYADTYLIAFEDLPYDFLVDEELQNQIGVDIGDQDYQDLLVLVTFNIIPEPSSLVILGLGLAGLAVGRFRKIVA